MPKFRGFSVGSHSVSHRARGDGWQDYCPLEPKGFRHCLRHLAAQYFRSGKNWCWFTLIDCVAEGLELLHKQRFLQPRWSGDDGCHMCQESYCKFIRPCKSKSQGSCFRANGCHIWSLYRRKTNSRENNWYWTSEPSILVGWGRPRSLCFLFSCLFLDAFFCTVVSEFWSKLIFFPVVFPWLVLYAVRAYSLLVLNLQGRPLRKLPPNLFWE